MGSIAKQSGRPHGSDGSGASGISKNKQEYSFSSRDIQNQKWIFMWLFRITREIFRITKWIFMWISRITRVDLMNIFENISKWKRIFHVEEQFKWIFQKLIMNILLEYSEMEWISKWISNTSRNEDWIFKRIIKIWMNIQLNIYLNIQRHLKWREYSFKYSFEYSLPF